MPRSILMLPGLKIPIRSEKITKFKKNQLFENFDFQTIGRKILKNCKIGIFFCEESDFDHPRAQKYDPGQFKQKSAGRPMMRRAMDRAMDPGDPLWLAGRPAKGGPLGPWRDPWRAASSAGRPIFVWIAPGHIFGPGGGQNRIPRKKIFRFYNFSEFFDRLFENQNFRKVDFS